MKYLILILLLLLTTPAWAQAPPDIYYNDFEFPDMRSFTFSPGAQSMTFLPPGEQSPAPANGGVCGGFTNTGVCTGFNTNWDSRNQIINDPANCHSGSWCARMDMAAGAGSFPAIIESGAKYPGGPQACSTGGLSPNCYSRHLFFSYWIRFAPNWELIAGVDGICQGKILYFDAYGTNGTGGIIVFRPQGGNVMNINVEHFTNSAPFQIFADGQWHHLEVEFWVGNFINVWWDEVLKVDHFPDGQDNPNTAVDSNKWGLYMNVIGHGDCVAKTTSSFWIDDLAVSTQRIGGGSSGDTTPPTIQITGPTTNSTYLTRFTPLEIALWLTVTALGAGFLRYELSRRRRAHRK